MYVAPAEPLDDSVASKVGRLGCEELKTDELRTIHIMVAPTLVRNTPLRCYLYTDADTDSSLN